MSDFQLGVDHPEVRFMGRSPQMLWQTWWTAAKHMRLNHDTGTHNPAAVTDASEQRSHVHGVKLAILDLCATSAR